MAGKCKCTFAHAIFAVLVAATFSFSQKTIHFFSPWITDPARINFDNYIQGQSNGGFNSWWPGTIMTNEGGGWYSFTFPAGSGANDIQFRIMNAGDPNAATKMFALPTGLSPNQAAGFQGAVLSPFTTNDDLYLYYDGNDLPIISTIPPQGKYLMVFNPFQGASKAQVEGRTTASGMIAMDSPCGWFMLPIIGNADLKVRFINSKATETYGAAGLGSNTYIDLTGKFATTDTIWMNTPAAGPDFPASPNGLKGKCPTISLATIIRDFKTDKSHPDFETVGWDNTAGTCAGLQTGLVDVNLGADRKPVKVKAGCKNSRFDDWFGRTGTAADYFTGCLNLGLTMNADGVYEKQDDAFFPIDGLTGAMGAFNGMGVDVSPDNSVHAHNYGFCMETHARFTYRGGEVFTFRGDDDVWVYINDKLVVDLGNVHQELSDTVALDTLKLTKGQVYNFDFFFCERQSTGSHMWITTDIDLIEARDVLLDRQIISNGGIIQYRYAVFINTQGGVGCVTENRTDKLTANYELTKQGSGVRTSLTAGNHYGGGIQINATRDTVVVDTTHMFGLDSGSTYILYVIDPNATGIYDSIVFHIPQNGTVPPPPNLGPTAVADTFSVAEDKDSGTVVGKVVASDPENNPLTYVLSGTGPFQIDGSGNISLTGPIDYERTDQYKLTVIVSDGELSDTVSILVKVTNVAEPIEVRIVSVKAGDSLWANSPDTVFTNALKADLNGEITGSMITGVKDTVARVTLKEGINKVGIKVCTSDSLACSADSVIIVVNTTSPTVDFEHPKPDTSGLKNLVYTYTASDTFFVNSPWAKIPGTLVYKNKELELDTLDFQLNLIDYKLKEGVNNITYTYTDAFGNTVTADLVVVLDTTPPVVVIQKPTDKQIFTVYNIDVIWTVDGENMDTLNRASLSVGGNRIMRFAMDRAGNVGSDTVSVILKLTGADVAIDLVKPIIILKPSDVDEAFSVNPPRKDERFSLSIVNRLTDKEDEVAYGTSSGKIVRPEEVGKGRTYSTQGKDAHVGPTLRIEVKLQPVGGMNGTGNLRGGTVRELIEWAAANQVTPEDALCGEDIPESQYDSLPLWRNQVKVVTQFFDNLGQFVDEYTVSADSIGPDYLDDGGMATFNLSLSPDKESRSLKDSRGRALATGAYLVRGVVNATSTYLWCAGQYNQGDKIKSTENILKGFGYRRYDKKGK